MGRDGLDGPCRWRRFCRSTGRTPSRRGAQERGPSSPVRSLDSPLRTRFASSPRASRCGGSKSMHAVPSNQCGHARNAIDRRLGSDAPADQGAPVRSRSPETSSSRRERMPEPARSLTDMRLAYASPSTRNHSGRETRRYQPSREHRWGPGGAKVTDAAADAHASPPRRPGIPMRPPFRSLQVVPSRS
jgi:hypothetical protein